jgi:hypothetical protein
MANMWLHRELLDGTYDFFDLLDIHEALDVKQENERRIREWSRHQRELSNLNRNVG